MERHLRVHLQQRRNQSRGHNHVASVPEEDQTAGEAGAHGVQVGFRLFLSGCFPPRSTQGTERKP